MKCMRSLAGVLAIAGMGTWANASANVVTQWNAITMNCVQGPVTPANRGGPAGLLDIALVQASVHDAVQAIKGKFEAYEYEDASRRGRGSVEAAAASAAYATLAGLYGADDPCLANVVAPEHTYPGDEGVATGQAAAAAILPLYRPTMVLPTDPFIGGTDPGEWRPTPGVTQGAATFMAQTAPFAMKSPSQFRPAPPPHLKSIRYAIDYYEVMAIGAANSTRRSAAQTDTARFWSVNFFNQWFEAVRAIADKRVPDVGDSARLFALVAFAAADSQISVYESKYLYNYWRPITAIQLGSQDGNVFTLGDPTWTPFIPTPPYPEYSSGANCLAASITAVLRSFFGRDGLHFSVWTTAAGVNENPRNYESFTQLNREMIDVRIWQGIHFRTAEVMGNRQGDRIGRWTAAHYLKKVRPAK